MKPSQNQIAPTAPDNPSRCSECCCSGWRRVPPRYPFLHDPENKRLNVQDLESKRLMALSMPADEDARAVGTGISLIGLLLLYRSGYNSMQVIGGVSG